MTMTIKTNKQKRVTAIILAAGKGTRMKSPLPKVLHPVAGSPMIYRIIQNVKAIEVDEVRVVLGYLQQLIKNVIEPLGVNFFFQHSQSGTADAVKSAGVESLIGDVLILNGDHPLIESIDLEKILTEFTATKSEFCVVTSLPKNPKDFGRIVRRNGEMIAIVEAKDASKETLAINEINTGIYVASSDLLKELLPKISNNNSKGEYYFTDIVSLAKEYGYKVSTINAHPRVSFGVNDQLELSKANKYCFEQKCKALMNDGVIIMDFKNTYIEDSVQIQPGTVIYPNTHIKGKTKIGNFCVIEPGVMIIDSIIGDSTQIKSHSYIEKSKIETKCSIGPFARLRPETEILEEAHIGNFVELKKTRFGKKSKAGHLAYLGDAEIGDNVNIGCGTITCNYAADKKKYRTKIGSGVFVGSDSQFVAPVEVGNNAVIASGSTITQNVPAEALAIGRSKQTNKEGYAKKYLSNKE
jgi:bifunctional UDP-N-acetylglucosamine pyrophosphorylase/glucosamine-1-phosphate N-acetyltransferase